MILKNSFLEASIDERNGNILSLTKLSNGVKYLDTPEYAHLFRVLIPDESQWISQYCDSSDCTVDRIEKLSDESAKFYFADLVTPEGKILDVQAVVDMYLEDDELRLSLSVTNNTDLLLHSVRFPWVGGWEVDVDSDDDIARLGTEAPCILRKFKKGPGYTLLKKDMRNGIWIHIPTIDVSNKTSGIGLNHYCKIPQTMNGFICCETQGWDEEFISFGFMHYVFLSKGESYSSEPCGISVHNGDHTKTWDRMKSFIAGWWKKPDTPKYLSEAIGYATYPLRDFEGREANKVSDLPKLCAEAREMGIYDVTFWDMMFNVYLRAGDGWYMQDTEENRTEKIKQYVLAEKEKGMRLSTLVNFRLTSSRSPLYEERLKDFSLKSIYGKEMYESFPIRSESAKWYTCEYEEYAHPMCQNDKRFQRHAINLADEVMNRIGTNALFIDQPFGNNYCFNREHDHSYGKDDHKGALEWIKQVRENLSKREDFAYIVGEVPEIFNTQYIDLWWHWPWNEQGPEAVRYIIPESIQSWTIDVHEHQHEINRAFSLGMLLCLISRGVEGVMSECPEVIKRVKRLSDLKHKTIARIPLNGFKGNKNLRTESDLALEVNAYETADGKRALILGDWTKRSKGGTAVLFIDDKSIDINKIHVISEYGNEYDADFKTTDSGYELELDLKPWEALVLYLD